MQQIISSFTENNSLFYFFIIMLVFGFADFMGVFTKAKVSSVFVVMVVFLVGFMTGVFPTDIVEQAFLTQFASMSAAILIFHMGTMINLKQLRDEWKTVVTAVASMIVVIVTCFILIPIIGKENAIVAIPVLNGGIISTQIMSSKAAELGLVVPAAFAAILYAVKKFAGSYPASYVGMQEAKTVLAAYRDGTYESKQTQGADKKRKGLASKHTKYFTDFVCLMIAVCFAWIAVSLGKLIPSINYSIWSLLFGAILGYYDVVPTRILEKGKASGVFSMLVYVTIIPSLGKVTFTDLMALGMNIVVTLGVTIAVLYVVFAILPGWKLLKSKHLAFGVALAQYLGFPATYLVSQEISKAITDDEIEQQIVFDHIMPSYVVAGMTTVTTLSIVVAGIFVAFL